MEESELEKLRYPIGHLELPDVITQVHLNEWISILEHLPGRLENLVKDLTEEQLETPYRPGGWTVRQMIHHIADSHHHSYTRFKWALSEDRPLIKAYQEKNWAMLFDAQTGPIGLSLDYIKALHGKLVYLLKGLSPIDLERVYIHPDGNMPVSVAQNIGKYAWHGSHHLAHIENLLKRNGWI
ncbi:putative metal-dependent hydrolase [Flavobacteriaceae bacterium KMM 6897]|nr:putative metal-dependent hydrolase [Flavobacteriaceae bacterium KMM 6897]MEB8344674.1 putative metal-dependent hydrolase [Flavobacteriaceae bacterium KMM 6898]